MAQTSIAEARKIQIGQTATVSGIVINGEELGDIRYLQDKTAGIAIYDDQLSNINRGDSITVSGTIDEYYNLLEIKNVTSLTKHSPGNQVPEPIVLSTDEIGETYEGQLIRINNIEINNQGVTFAGNQNYSLTDGEKSGELRININSPCVGEAIPTGKFNLVAICSQFSSKQNDTQTGYQLLPRDMSDFIPTSSVNITSPVQQVGISKSSIILGWRTDVGASPFVRYGNSNSENSLTNYKTGDSTTGEENWHVVEITDLQPSEIIYAQVFSVHETDTAFSAIGAYVTESNSTGEIKVYFNSPVDETVATENIAQNIGNAIDDTLIAYINGADETIDFCIYNINNSEISNISEVLNNAYNRGVQIRFITCGSTWHSGVDDLNSGISVLERPYIQNDGIMHNKFAVIDANSENPDNPWVWTGSANLTKSQINTDANNIVFVQDQSLAKTYEIEFEEMWGSSGAQPSESNAKFGADKTDNTPHHLMIGGRWVECYFSSSDNTNQEIIDAIKTADNDLNVETMLITRSDLAYTIVNAKNRGAEVHVLINDKKDNTETVNDILSELPAGKFIADGLANGMLHHKLAIIDANFAASDPQVITGSHNWSNSANNKNDENTLIIHDAGIANQYFQQFARRFKENNGSLVVSAEKIEVEDLKIYPNPTKGYIKISSSKHFNIVRLFSLTGEKTGEWQTDGLNPFEINLQNKYSGIYLLEINFENGARNSYKIVVK